MSGNLRTMWIEELRGTPDRLIALAARARPEEVARKPAPDAFSVREIVHHLRDIEIEGHGLRLARLLSESEPLLPNVDGDRLARERRYNERPHEPALEEFRASRLASVARLEGLRPEDWSRTGNMENLGPLNVEGLVEIWRRHDREHLDEVSALVMGGAGR